MEAYGGQLPDPAVVSEVAHETAQVLVHAGRASDDPDVTTRLVALVEDIGLSTLAELWAQLPARTLPGALWRLYALREWVRRDAVGASADYQAGMPHAAVLHAVAGAAEPPGPGQLQDLADAILSGVYDGDLAVALERAGAFCRIVAAGRAHRADTVATTSTATWLHSAGSMLGAGEDLEASARLWRLGQLT
ncbi:hypothetical protein ADJ73_01375 [Arsenicicoccus sp. oral taxon 190]|nr:hypothetical protein ADJ73_01375 [Arsenicicoccus sp. oral taxon 190]